MLNTFNSSKLNKKRLLFYFGGFAPVGGIETFCKNILLYLQKKNYICKLLCWGSSSTLLETLANEKVDIIRSPWRWGCKYNIPDWVLLPLGLQKIKSANIVIFGKLFHPNILKLLRSQSDRHTQFVFITPYRPSVPSNPGEKNRLLETLNLFDLILVQASIFSTDLRNIGYQGRIEIVPYLPQDSNYIKSLPSTKELRIGFLGRLVDDKNIPLLLKAFKILHQNYLNQTQAISLNIFGDGYLHQDLEELARQLEIKDSVTFHGSLPNSQVAEAIASCHLFAFTSNVEGQCLAALEILSCGRPIVATEAGALPDILSDSQLGRLVQSPNPQSFANSLLEVFNLLFEQIITPETIRLAYLERYDSNKVSDRYIKILNSLEMNK